MGKHEAGGEDEPQEAACRDEEVPGDPDAPELRGGVRDDHDRVILTVVHGPSPAIRRQQRRAMLPSAFGQVKETSPECNHKILGYRRLPVPGLDLIPLLLPPVKYPEYSLSAV